MQNTAQKEELQQPLPREGALARATHLIADDARVEPAKYLEESLVPKGGE